MMDMYYGLENNDLYKRRNPTIAEFIHYAMEFTPPFDLDTSGRDMFKQTFPGVPEGWMAHADTNVAYGHSATKEMSKIIREGIKTSGGQIILEGTAIYGAGIFDPTARQGDTDLECQELFKHFYVGSGATVPFGKGSIQFQWRGKPTVPSRVHFLTNWGYSNDHLHCKANQLHQTEVVRLLGPNHGLRPIWNHFKNVPSDPDTAEIAEVKKYLSKYSSVSGFGYGV